MSFERALAPNDWLEHPELLPERPQSFTEAKFTRYFAVDLHGQYCHDQYVLLSPNGIAVIGVAPSHPLVAAHRKATGYTALQLKYVPPQLGHLQAHELAAAAVDDDAQEDGDAGAANVESCPAEEPSQAENVPNLCPQDEQPSSAGVKALEEPVEGNGASAMEGGEPAGPASEDPGLVGAKPTCDPFPLEQCARINFDVGAAHHLQGAKQSGKAKKRGRDGGGVLRGNSMLAAVERRGGSDSGRLLEVNERLQTDPGILYNWPCREGYLAVLAPVPEAVSHLRNRLLSEAAYLRLRGLTPEELL